MTVAARRRLTDQERALRTVTEAEFLGQVIELAHLLGWRVAHFRPAFTSRGWRTPVQGDGVGFPDLVLVGRGRIIAAELKRETGTASPDQLAWLAAFADAGVPTFVWRPRDLDAIAAELSR
jgi:hypothetical protein